MVLADGCYFTGSSVGAPCPAPVLGELVFTTGMTGYQEAVTDPSFAGQLLCFAQPLVGNYGVSPEARESPRVHCKAVVCRELCEKPFHYAGTASFAEFLAKEGVPAVTGVDTRSVVLAVRRQGVMPAALQELAEGEDAAEAAGRLAALARGFDYSNTDFVREVGCREPYALGDDGRETLVLLDYGAKGSIARELVALGFRVVVMPPSARAEGVLALKPVGVVASNGPGDPARLGYAVDCIRGLAGRVPLFGVCLGHQLLARALGGETFKLKFGHRGANQPVRDELSGKCFITSQNHGYAVRGLPSGVDEWFTNLNDGTNEGLLCEERRCSSVQFHPEASPGPRDARWLFKKFAEGL